MCAAEASDVVNPAPIRVLIVDDHPLVRDGFAAVLERVTGLEIVGTSGHGASGVRMVEALRPDVLLLDLNLPDQSGIEVAQRVRANWPGVAIIVVTGYSVRNHARLLAQLGVRGIVHKSAPSDKLVSAIRAAAEGRAVPDSPRTEARETLMADPLTVREHEVLALVAAGLRNSEIAKELHVSVNTVEFHMRNLLGKLGARSRTEAVGRARTLGYSLPEDVPFH